MSDNYSKIVQNNLKQLYANRPHDLASCLPGTQQGDQFLFQAFGEECVIGPGEIRLGNQEHSPVFGILISLYALNARADACVVSPLRAFKEFPDSAPYVGAFATHTEQMLVPHVAVIQKRIPEITRVLNGGESPAGIGGDFSFLVFPLPKVALCYIFYEADEDFPASVTCLYSNNARLFLPMDGLADVGEYTSRKIVDIIRK